MKPHVKIYLDHCNYTVADTILSEISGKVAKVIHHIHRRGMGGCKSLDRIENLMALTDGVVDSEHIAFGDKKEFKAMLYRIHMAKLEAIGKPFDRNWMLNQIERHEVACVVCRELDCIDIEHAKIYNKLLTSNIR